MLKTIATLLAATFLLAACNTVRGMGEDLQKAGQEIEKASKK